jgi:hypothetical protein
MDIRDPFVPIDLDFSAEFICWVVKSAFLGVKVGRLPRAIRNGSPPVGKQPYFYISKVPSLIPKKPAPQSLKVETLQAVNTGHPFFCD